MEFRISTAMAEAPASTPERERAVINSALWAAAGDALGWITELTDEDGLVSRAGLTRVTSPIPWRRLIGGRFGVRVPLPAGAYSDDTQLRLAVSRAVRGNGAFDAEAFAKIELTVWPSYALGGGQGTKAAAQNLVRRDVNWFSNFFVEADKDYMRSGGNGAAMRIQPHVWGCEPSRRHAYLVDVLRNALVTHGHPHGFCGAALHARILAATFARSVAPGLEEWQQCIDDLAEIPAAIEQDRQLAAFWRPAWEQASGVALADVVKATSDEARRDLHRSRSLVERDDPERYREFLESLGCLEPRYRGSGLKTTLAAAGLLWLTRDQRSEEVLIRAANVLDSDTDTIATMAGALRGALEKAGPNWPLQDRTYIEEEARRLAKIARGEPQDSFAYPDPGRWRPPTNQSDAVGRLADGFAVLGLGPAIPEGDEFIARDRVWQWLRLTFGQTVLAKRRRSVRVKAHPDLLPGPRRVPRLVEDGRIAAGQGQAATQGNLPLGKAGGERQERNGPVRMTIGDNRSSVPQSQDSRERNLPIQGALDSMTSRVIQSNFDDLLLGRLLNRCIDEYGSVEASVAFAAIIAKAKLARQRRGP
jgi:ADP-ribosylglycohydrolase